MNRGSQICADCSAPDAPWASLNRGVLICDECCSVHRILGRHISQVKSLKKSPWAPSQLTMVTLLYAKGANLLWEHALVHPASNSPGVLSLGKVNRRKPAPKDPIHPNKSEYIRAKYQLQSFVHRPAKDEPQCSYADLSQQLHSSVRTSNVEISLRLLCLGADPNYWHPEKGNRPLHVAARAGQWSQVELLVVYAADPGTPDIAGKTPADHARSAGFPEMADRLMECQYELTDRLAYFLCQRKPDHAVGQHFIIPELTMERSQNFNQLAKSARRNVQALNNALFESLAMDVYDEVDRQETDNIWQAGQGPTITSDRHITAFLPVNPRLSAVHNQARQKLARLHPGEFHALVVDVLAEVRRRQTGLERSPTLDVIPSNASSTVRSASVTESTTVEEQQSSTRENSGVSVAADAEDDREPLYDAVAVEDDYVDAKDDGVFGGNKKTAEGHVVNGNAKAVATGPVAPPRRNRCVCQSDDSKVPLDQPCPACDSVVTAAQYFEMKRALKEAVEREARLTSTVYAMKDDLNRLFTQVGTLLHPTSSHPPSTGALSPSSARQAQIVSVEPVFAKSIRDDSGIQEGQDEPQSGSNGNHVDRGEHSQTDGVSFPSHELLEQKTGVITQSIHSLKKAAEDFDTSTLKSCTGKIEDSVQDLVDLFQPFQFNFPVTLGEALADLKQTAEKLSADCHAYVSRLPPSPERASRAALLSKDTEQERAQATQMVIDDAYSIVSSLKCVLVMHAAQLSRQQSS
ncbi:ARF GTPase-activating protein GIT2 [Hypsibius exemplaris]|uniref:ARF GTPase-activating protein GIT2 n=1 Tax=Hypsibius exemplaris TaxID=2072580 RepID=A0A9X6RJL5_HYPEX|nr:ARF GTPase-activating protein GIT2 [Hypsibius exemplaris]